MKEVEEDGGKLGIREGERGILGISPRHIHPRQQKIIKIIIPHTEPQQPIPTQVNSSRGPPRTAGLALLMGKLAHENWLP